MTRYTPPPEPTSDQCTRHAIVLRNSYQVGYAVWYPQMGGYVGRAVAVVDPRNENACIDVFVWHDGEFPFDGCGERGCSPVRLHHCDPLQFVAFGEGLQHMQETAREEVKERRHENPK